eukprot:2131209-Prymnesium_polylepis.1
MRWRGDGERGRGYYRLTTIAEPTLASMLAAADTAAAVPLTVEAAVEEAIENAVMTDAPRKDQERVQSELRAFRSEESRMARRADGVQLETSAEPLLDGCRNLIAELKVMATQRFKELRCQRKVGIKTRLRTPVGDFGLW